jgi:hypothetical protein
MNTPSADLLHLEQVVDPVSFLREVLAATNVAGVEALLAQLPIVSEKDFYYNVDHPTTGWQPGRLHWIPLGRDPGNAGRVRLATRPENPLAERAINSMEAVIELMRLRELNAKPHASVPASPREAVQRYFGLPPLPELARLPRNHELRTKARQLADQIRLSVDFDKRTKEFAVQLRDHGMGQSPERIHRTLLSLGASDKGDKPYLIGVFGQGGSSAYMASTYSWCVSRREASLADAGDRAIGWTVVKQVFPTDRRDTYFAYLAGSPNGQVPALPSQAADAVGFQHGTLFSHLKYDFSGGGGSAISRTLFQSLSHVLYNPVLPLTTVVGGTSAVLWGNAYRLADATADGKTAQDKTLPLATL